MLEICVTLEISMQLTMSISISMIVENAIVGRCVYEYQYNQIMKNDFRKSRYIYFLLGRMYFHVCV